jgi:plasmid stabilization system protein ParE
VIYELVFAGAAKKTYAAIQTQIQNRWGDRSLKKFETKTVKTLATISQSPFIFKSVTENQNIRKGLIHKNCSVFYEVKERHIEILFFWDNRQEPIL